MTKFMPIGGILLAVAIVSLLSGCAGEDLHKEGMKLLEKNQLEEGISKLEAAARKEPENRQFQVDFINKRSETVNSLLTKASAARSKEQFDTAEMLYKQILKIDSSNENAKAGVDAIAMEKKHKAIISLAKETFEKGDSEKALTLLKPVMIESPTNSNMLELKHAIEEQESPDTFPNLRLNYNKPITLQFRDANLKMVFEALSRTTGINFILDKDIRPDLKVAIFLTKSSLEDAVNLILSSTQLEKTVLNRESVLIYPDIPEKIKQYKDLLVRSFYLDSADAQQMSEMIKTVLKTKDIYVDKTLNALTIRDTPETIRMVGKLIAMHDLKEPEVMLEVEVLEIQRSKLLNLGIQLPQQLTLTPLPTNGTALTLNDLKTINSNRIGANISGPVVNMQKQDSNVNLLANPRIRVRNHEKAKILIGDKVPVITTTSTATGFVSESVQYLDVGLKLDVEPAIYLNGDVAIKVGLEVSSIVKETTTPSGTRTYQLGTRNASTLLSLKDGETQVLAGLINDDERVTANKFPGLGDLPIVGRLFSSTNDNNQKTEIVLSITPHLVRNLKKPDASSEEFWSGTENRPGSEPILLPVKTGGNTSPQDRQQPSQDHNSFSATSVSNAEPTSIDLSWQGPSQVKVGEKFKVTLKLKSDGGLTSFPFQLGFDASSLQVVDVAEGGYFKQDDAATNFTSNVDLSGKIFLGASRSSANGVKGDESLTIVTFKAIAANPKAEVKVLAAVPIGSGSKVPLPSIPVPFVISIVKP